MCACTKKTVRHTPVTAYPPRATWPRASNPLGAGSVTFEYTGRTALTAIGRVTGRQYRFGTPGARAAVDTRDQTSLAAVPQLRLVRG
jgi:hypothetical protein